jgi:hypothetical protein
MLCSAVAALSELVCVPTRKRLKAPAGDPLELRFKMKGGTAQAGNTLFDAASRLKAD